MGRKHYKNERTPQHTRHQREQGGEGIGLGAFGIRRMLERRTSMAIVAAMVELKEEGIVPDNMRLRMGLHTTLLPKQAYRHQVRLGRVGGVSVVTAHQQMERRARGRSAKHAPADMIDIGWYKGRVLVACLESERIEADCQAIDKVLGFNGVRGIDKRRPPLHASLGNVTEPLSLKERNYIADAAHERFDAVCPQEEPWVFDPWTVYPHDVLEIPIAA